ncbi:MAG: response regulator, partial [Anaerolineales bacterium]|nr:response regulator [Anaerolineales bacterium]
KFALAFAQQAAIAVENAQLYSRAISEIDERRQVEIALQIERAHLAEHVKERTAELSAANAQLVHAVRARDEFLASMSHELRTPLNAILGMTEVLQTGAYGSLSDKQQDLLRTIVRSGHHLLELINDILDIAKIEAGQLALHLYPIPIPAMCHTCIDLVKAMAAKKQIQVLLDISKAANVIWGDELRVQQILINLLNNAIKFTPANGKIGLEVTVDTRRTTAYFTVWDTGIGMSLADLRQLFSGPNGPKPFVQLDSGLSRQYEGTGLGLSLVYHLTELHGGSLAIKSEVGQGSRLTVALPCQSIVREVETFEGKITQTVEPRTILLAEDNELYARAISAYLLAQGYRLVVAHTGLQAVQQARTTQPDLILLDLQMPEVGGLETLNLIHENTHLRDVPIIMWTALAMPGDEDYYLRQGATAFLQKPLYLPELADTIANLLSNKG